MIQVLVYTATSDLHIREFNRRFGNKFAYRYMGGRIEWEDMRIAFVQNEPIGRRADIVIGFNPVGVERFTANSCVNIKEKRSTTYFDLLAAINDDGSFNWKYYLEHEDDDWLTEL